MSTIAELLVRIGASNDGLKKTLNESQSLIQTAFSTVPINNFTGALSGATTGISGMIGKLSGLATLAAGGFGLGVVIEGAVNAGEAAYQLSARLGISSGEAANLSRILKLTGGDSESFAGAMMRLDKNLVSSGTAGKKTRDTLALFGVSLTDSTGKLLPLNEQLANLSKGYKLAAANGLQQEFVMETLGVRGMALVKTLQEYDEASEKAGQIKGVGLNPQQLHELKMEMDLVSIQASQIGLAFTGALAPVAKSLFPPIMSGLQTTAAFLSQNKGQVMELTKDALELLAAYKGIQLLASAGNAIGSFWQAAEAEALASAASQATSATKLSAAQERAINRTVAASDKMYAKMQADAVKTAQAAGMSAEETAAIISEKCVEIANAGATAAAKIRADMTAAFMAQAQAAQIAGSETVAANEMAAASARTAAVAEAEMTAATVAQGNAAVVAGEETVSAMATAKVAAGNFLSGLVSLAGGWIGVAIATGYAIEKLLEYFDTKNKVDSYNPKAEVYDDPDRPGMHLKKQWVEEAGVTELGTTTGGYMKVPLSDAEEEEWGSWHTWREKQENSKPWLQGDATIDPDLASKMAAIEQEGQKEHTPHTHTHDYEAAIQRANEQAAQLMADLNKRIAGSSSYAYATGMANITDEVQRMNNEVADIAKNGGDASGLSEKIAEYQKVAAAKVRDTWRQAWQDVSEQASLVNAQLLHNKNAEADEEYQIALTRIEKERKAEIDAIAQNGNDTVAIAQANADAAAKIKAAAQKRDYAKGDNLLQNDQQALESASLMVNIANKTQAQVDAIRQQGLQKYNDDLKTQYNAAAGDADRQLQLARQRSTAISEQNGIAANNMKTAWDVAFTNIKNQQTNFAGIIENAWSDVKSKTESAFEQMADAGESATKALRNVFQTVIQDIENMFIKMWTDKYILAPLQQLIGGLGSGNMAVSNSSASPSGGLSSMPSAVEASPLQGFAYGGDASGWAIVGEQGPELAYFGDTAHVYTASQSQAIMGGASVASNPNVNVTVVNRSGQQLNVSQQAQYDPAAHTMLMQMFVDGVSQNLAGSRDLLFGRG